MNEKKIIENIINLIPAGIFAINNDFNIIYWNQKMADITGLQKEEILNKNVNLIKLYEKNDSQRELLLKDCLKINKKMENIIYILNKNNEFKEVYINATHDKKDLYTIVTIIEFSNIESCKIVNDNQEEKYVFHNIVGKDKNMLEIYKKIELASESLANVLIIGESGTGKELVAKAIHEISDRKDNPFIIVNCSALSETLLESELFGHVKGSFTGAYKDKIGKFELSHSGTIFLDEIGDISPLIQLKLLRVIQEKTIQRVGDNQDIKVDMRIITATNKNLRQLVNEGKFREDLFYRLNVFPIYTIPLRERKNDISLLSMYFIKKFNKQTGKKISGFTEDAARLIMDYCWPGNVRELENCIEHAFVICSKDLIDIFDLPQELRIVSIKQGICKDIPDNPNIILKSEIKIDDNINKKVYSRNIKKNELIELLNKNKWNKNLTAKELGISRIALWKKIKKFEI